MPDELITEPYWQKCGSFGSIFVGTTGGIVLGALTKVAESKPLFMISDRPQVKPFLKKLPQLSQVTGAKNVYGRVALQALGCAYVYSFLECKFQRGHRRTMFDAGLAGAITGGAFGLRGKPGGTLGAVYGAAGFTAYAVIMQLLFR
ncbi:Mitochondrial import inner membrane translocase subunit TIM22-1 [Orchesella cincta]|uniref:Mitochondrial import inner membrane translocase subunit TIM22-1 n=1 Tax=Orchesella cincta TaxID=48709 RepID=A0A1D2MUH9_ORCCI|nr:Mitochondrial import inner membrane translocase subunit TIM22-1 [Orchesella cincta]